VHKAQKLFKGRRNTFILRKLVTLVSFFSYIKKKKKSKEKRRKKKEAMHEKIVTLESNV